MRKQKPTSQDNCHKKIIKEKKKLFLFSRVETEIIFIVFADNIPFYYGVRNYDQVRLILNTPVYHKELKSS